MSFTVAIMQPYFVPYAGYFRLISGADLFVVYDCVQFPRRGWVHRNKLNDAQGGERWLTLPLQSAPQDVLIQDLVFAPGASAALAERLQPFSLSTPQSAAAEGVFDCLRTIKGAPVDYIERLLEAISVRLDLGWKSLRSSSLQVPDTFRGQDRIIEIARRVGAEAYLNAPGGRSLYDPEAFAASGMQLQFLPNYEGPTSSILQRLANEDTGSLRSDILNFQVQA